jgi:hypothetical protein
MSDSQNIQLGFRFSLDELTRTSTGISNVPDVQSAVNLGRLVALFLDPLREAVGAINVTSGFRSPPVNKAVGGSRNSYHMKGLAADIQSSTETPQQMAEEAEFMGLPYDKMIIERLRGSRWLHVQIAEPGTQPRKRILIAEDIDGTTTYREFTT